MIDNSIFNLNQVLENIVDKIDNLKQGKKITGYFLFELTLEGHEIGILCVKQFKELRILLYLRIYL